MTPQKFKQTEIGKVTSINPKRDLKKGIIAKKVSMEKLNPFTKKIQGFEITEFKGGSKFVNGDTLLARITPCLENGKTAYVDFLDENEVGFGSTEFIVLSGKEGESINEFVYYLAVSPNFRNQAISSMTGTSGRQRVQNDFLSEKEIKIPPLPEQKSISQILSKLDEKIELNNKMNKTLEEIGQAIFKKWFLENPERGKWGEGKLGDFGKFKNGINYLRDEKGDTEFSIVNVRNISNNRWLMEDNLDKIKINLTKAKDYIIKEKDILIARSACPGKVSLVLGNFQNIIYSGFSIRYRLEDIENYYYFVFVLEKLQKELTNFSIGTTLTSVNQETLKNIKIKIPDNKILLDFNKMIDQVFNKISNNCFQIQTLSQIRDSLLPKLMSGKIRVPIK